MKSPSTCLQAIKRIICTIVEMAVVDTERIQHLLQAGKLDILIPCLIDLHDVAVRHRPIQPNT